MNNKTVCIIGAGPCGLTAGKNLLEQGFNNFTIFDKNSHLGGNWLFDESSGHSSIYETTHLISSKKLSSFEDYPMPCHYPDYPSHNQILQYFKDYAEHFGINPFIRLKTQVEKVVLGADKKWLVCLKNTEGLQEAYFDYLFIANGHHWDPMLPQIPGIFEGEILHSHSYKKASPFANKRVLVVGGGNSACDIAVEVSRIATKSCLSMRKGQHIFPKFVLGKPTDILFNIIRWMPFSCKQRLAKIVIRILQGRYPKYNLQTPKTLPLEEHPTINSELLYYIRHGKITPHKGIKSFAGKSVSFVDGHQEEFDTIIFATGYKISFPFLDKELLDFSNETEVPLYRKMIHPSIDNVFFIGLFQPQGCIWPLADFQAKIAAKIVNGTLKRPENLDKKIQKEMKQGGKKFVGSTRHRFEVDYPSFRKQLLKELME